MDGELPDNYLDNYVPGKGAATPAPPPVQAAPQEELPDNFLETYVPGHKTPIDYNQVGWGQVGINAAKNFLPDAPSAVWDAGKGLWDSALEGAKVVTNPLGAGRDAIKTAKGLGTIAKGAYDYYEGNETPEGKVAGDIWNNVSEANLKQYLSEYPAHAGLWAGAALSAPEYALDRAGLEAAAWVPRIARHVVDPISQADTLARYGLPVATHAGNELIGHFGTGTEGEALNVATNAGYKGGDPSKNFINNINQNGNPLQVQKNFKRAMEDFRKERWSQYQSNKAAMARDKQQLDLQPALDEWDTQNREFSSAPGGPGGNVVPMPNQLDKDTMPMRKAIADTLSQWHGNGMQNGYWLPPGRANEYYTPLGFDLLKKNLNSLRDNPSLNIRPESEVILNRVVGALRKEIGDKAPHYNKWMNDDEEAHQFIEVMKREFSTNNPNPATTMGKFMSSLRSDTAARNGLRAWIKNKFAQNPNAYNGMAGIAGQVLSAKWPRGLTGSFISKVATPGLAGALGYGLSYLGFNPWLALPAAPAMWAAQSPYLMGRMAHLSGKLGRLAEQVPWRGLAYTGAAANSLPSP